jgi:hypothetical protein
VGLKTCSGKAFSGWIASWMTKTQREHNDRSSHCNGHFLTATMVRFNGCVGLLEQE